MLNAILLLGGVALFLYGISLMGDNLKKVAGNKMELILYKLSGTPFKGILLGTVVTAVIQSSSATSVMVVGFVNSGMMKLRQAISVVMGAIIGTSITGWIICLSEIGSNASGFLSVFSTESLAAIVAIIAILIKYLSKKSNGSNVAMILFGFAVLMFGMETMSGSVSSLKENEAFVSLLVSFSNPVIGILFGAVFTAILQSASAAVGIIQVLSMNGMLSFSQAFPIILGIAIGASVPVLLSAVGASVNAKRTALSYLTIDTIGSILVGIIYYSLNAVFSFEISNMIMSPFSIALLNSLFRVAVVVLLGPFIGVLEKLSILLVKDDPKEIENRAGLNYLEERFLKYPPLAIEQSKMAIIAMSGIVKSSLMKSIDLLWNFSNDVFEDVAKFEEITDQYEDKIGTYLMKITRSELSEEQGDTVTKFLYAISDFERISDHARNIAESAQEMYSRKIGFTKAGQGEMNVLTSAVTEVVNLASESFVKNDVQMAYRIEPLEEVVDELCDILKLHHAERLQRGECTIEKGYVFNDLLINFERVSDHCSNIGAAMVDIQTGGDLDMHMYVDDVVKNNLNHFDDYYDEYKDKYISRVEE